MKTRYDCFLFEKILQGVCADIFTRQTLINIVAAPCKRTHHCWATLRRSQYSRNVGTCWDKRLTGFKLYATSASQGSHDGCPSSTPAPMALNKTVAFLMYVDVERHLAFISNPDHIGLGIRLPQTRVGTTEVFR